MLSLSIKHLSFLSFLTFEYQVLFFSLYVSVFMSFMCLIWFYNVFLKLIWLMICEIFLIWFDLVKGVFDLQVMGEQLGELKVTVVQGKTLVIRDFKSSDPYVVLKLGNQVMILNVVFVI